MSRHTRDAFPDNGFLRGADNQFVGRIERRSDGSEWILDLPENQYVGRYDPHMNQTWDISGNLVGFGNLLTSLLGRR